MPNEPLELQLAKRLFNHSDEIGVWLAFQELGHANHNLAEVAKALRECLNWNIRTLDHTNPFRQKSIEIGIRSYGMVLTRLYPRRVTETEPEEFRLLVWKVLRLGDESMVSYALTAMFEDAPVHCVDLLPKLYSFRVEKRSEVGFRLGSYLDRCISVLEECQRSDFS
jgi:hypothetical protein